MPEPPVYLTISEIARELGYNPRNFNVNTHYWQNDPEHPPPTPDAYSIVKGGYQTPLWLPRRLDQWRTWDTQRRTLGRRRQGQTRKDTTT